MLTFLFSLLLDGLGSYFLLHWTRRSWAMVPGAILIGLVSGCCVVVALSVFMGVRPGQAMVAAIGGALTHAFITVPVIFWLRWWLSPFSR